MAADENDTGEKTERPTAKRLSEARTEGQVARSTDLSQVMGLIAAFIGLQMVAPRLWRDLLIVTQSGLSGKYSSEEFSLNLLQSQFIGLLKLILPDLLFITIIAALFGAGTTALQTKFLWSNKLLKPKFRNLNPVSGIKRLFSTQNAVNVLKALAKLCIIAPIAYFAFFEVFPEIMELMRVPITHLLPFTSQVSTLVFRRIMSLLLVLAILDYLWQSYKTNKELKMTKVEIKEERKAVEGDEKTKLQIRAKAMQRARENMFAAVRTADVVVTNPTHIAVAIKYNLTEDHAPKVVAKGKGFIAEKIKEIAAKDNIPVIERKPLARALFANVEIGQFITYELFAAVAELLAYVYKLKGKSPFGRSGSGNKRNE
ncbi:MAG: EscU/YscU/HrcU family type III secretion system export apparatus switch protein [Deltaproteobacteria bacterium]|nr:EscU/YscU/HrcU family type III secretion system export apparatus switch protein [Deltaproteobacteria bacterium]